MKFYPASLPVLALAAFSCLSACHRAPQTADELSQRLPRRYIGELRWQGETSGQRIRVEPRELIPRDTHTLAFSGVTVELLDTQGGITSERIVTFRGAISAPELAITIEDAGALSGEDMLKPGTFQGKLSQDLQSIEANWTSGFGGKGTLKLKTE